MTWSRCRWRPGCAGPPGGPGSSTPTPTLAGPPAAATSTAWRDGPDLPWGHPDFVLAAAVRQGILTRGQAALIGRNRLEGVPLSQIAAETGISHSALCNRRKKAEKAITDAIASGFLRGLISRGPREKRGRKPDFCWCGGSPPRAPFRGGRPARRGAAAAADNRPPSPPEGGQSRARRAGRPRPRTSPGSRRRHLPMKLTFRPPGLAPAHPPAARRPGPARGPALRVAAAGGGLDQPGARATPRCGSSGSWPAWPPCS